MSDWQPFTPVWTHPKFKWWQFIAKWRYNKAMQSLTIAKYKLVGKTIHVKIGGRDD